VGWLILGVWIGAVVLAAVVLGFCAYELAWKGKRLTADLGRLRASSDRLTAVQAEAQAAVQAARQRLSDTNA
jgi:outer membrane murein-binding lipoprotein Lpp